MKNSKILLLLCFSFLLTHLMVAQEKTISGVVTSKNDGAPLPGVGVIIKGTLKGVETDFDGKYQIKASVGDVLLFTYVGMKTQSIIVSNQETLNVALEDSNVLNEVVVTALGIKKTRKSLTYAAQDLKGDELTKVQDVNPVNSLSGKISGLTVNRSSSGAGGSVKVVIRGSSSTRNNQPLYVIDGVPMLNNTINQPNSVFGDINGGNRDSGDAISLINPDDVESMTVLKGASASALYGAQGANGVILITTKSGKSGKAVVKVSSNTTFESVAFMPEFQTEYIGEAGSDKSWGVKQSVADHVDDFFSTGHTQITSVSLSAGNDKAQTYLSYANTTGEGVSVNNSINKHNFNIKETMKFFDDKLSVDASANLTTQKVNNRPGNGLYFNPLVGLYLGPNGMDWNDLENNYEVFDTTRNLYGPNPNWIESEIGQNPYWVANRNQTADTNERVVLSTALGYEVNDWLKLRSRMSYDKQFYTFDRKIHAGTRALLSHQNGRFIRNESESTQMYADLIALISTPVNEDLNLDATIGTSVTNFNLGRAKGFDSGIGATEGLKFANWFNISNFLSPNGLSETLGMEKEIQSVFGNVTLGYKEMLFLDLSARNDWSSTFANTDSFSFFYPSVGVTGVISEMTELPDFINFAKVRFSYAEVGNDIPSFITTPVNLLNAADFNFQTTVVEPGASIKPERQRSFEIGTDWRFFDNRFGFEFTYYNTKTSNQLITVPAPATNPFGASLYAFNGSVINNSGIELGVTGKPIVTEDFTWNVTANLAKNTSEVTDIPERLGGRIVLTDRGVNGYQYILENGKPFGVIEAQSLLRDENGNIQLDADGNLQKTEFQDVGNVQPDFTLGLSNTFSYKNLTFSFLIDSRFGGEVLSVTQGLLDNYGVSQVTADARNAGGVAINAVNADGSPFTGLYDARRYYETIGDRAGALGEYVYDATNVSLRELSLGYKLNLQSNIVKSANISLIARNLFFLYKEAPFDPNISLSTGEGLQGVDVFGQPSMRSIGVNINLTF